MVCAKSPLGCSTSRQLRKSSTSRWNASLSRVARFAEEMRRLPDQVERQVGEAEVDLEHRRMPAPFAQPLAEDQRIVAEPQAIIGARRIMLAGRRRVERAVVGRMPACRTWSFSIAGSDGIRCASPRRGCRRRSGGGRSCPRPARTVGPPVVRIGRDDLRRRHDPQAHALPSAACRCRARGGARAPRQEHERCQRGDATSPPLARTNTSQSGQSPAHAAFLRRRLASCAAAASRTQAPSSQASRRAFIRSLATGPSPRTTA